MAIVLTIVFVYGCALLLLCVFCAGSFAHTTTAADAHDLRTPPRAIVFTSCRGEKRTGIEYASAFLEAGLGHGFVSLPCVVSGGLSRLCNCKYSRRAFFEQGHGLRTGLDLRHAARPRSELAQARANGSLVVVPAWPTRLPNERLNVLVEHVLRYNTAVPDSVRARQFRLQDKAGMHIYTIVVYCTYVIMFRRFN